MPEELYLKTKVIRKIEEIPPDEWSRVFPDVSENYHFFKSVDESNFEQFSFFYILVYDNNSLVGATSCFLMDYPMDLAVNGVFRKPLNHIKKFIPGLFSAKTLICGLPMGQGRIGISADVNKVIRVICACMEKIAKEEKALFIAFKDFASDHREILDLLLEDGFARMHTLPSTELDISFGSFDEYLKTLSSASRSGLKRKLKAADSRLKIEMEVSDKLDDAALADVHNLYLQTSQRQDIDFERLPDDFFKNVLRNMPDKARFFLWRIDGKICAFAFCLVNQGKFVEHYLGFDYSVAYKYNLYFVRFRDLLNWCIANNIKKYEMGMTGYETKRRLGFNFIPLYIYAKPCSKLVKPLFKTLCRLFKPENFHPVLKEMKKTQTQGLQ